MTDHQLKIRIQIAQSQPSIECQYSESAARTEIDKLPLDWLKLSLALVLAGSLFGLVSFILFDGSNDKASLTDTAPSADPSASSDKSVTQFEDFQSVIALSEDQIENQAQAAAPENKIIRTQGLPEETAIEAKLNPETSSIVETKVIRAHEETPLSAIASVPIAKDRPQVVRAQLSRSIQRREPVDSIDHVTLDNGVSAPIYLFMQLRDLKGQKIAVHWYYQDKEVAKVNLKIGQQMWRTSASKLLTKTRLGAWHVELRDSSGKLLAQRNFTVSDRS